MKINVMIVDDSILQRAMIRSILERDKGSRFGVVASAHNGLDALEKLKRQSGEIDVIILDIEMPKMDGIETLKEIMEHEPKPVVMFSSLTKRGAKQTIEALRHGAVDFLTKPDSGELKNLAEELMQKVYLASKARPRVPFRPPSPLKKERMPNGLAVRKEAPSAKEPLTHLILIGTSTGGPRSLSTLMADIPPGLKAGVVIVQHMQTGGFTYSFANSLNQVSPFIVKEAEDGDEVLNGHAYVAPAGLQTEIQKRNGRYFISIEDKGAAYRHRPSVDVLFRSVARAKPSFPVFGVILTGMGDDGCLGCQQLRDVGATIVAESEKTAILYGMPRQVAARGLADYIEDLQNVIPRIERIIKSTS